MVEIQIIRCTDAEVVALLLKHHVAIYVFIYSFSYFSHRTQGTQETRS